jgi:hypothetical protein
LGTWSGLNALIVSWSVGLWSFNEWELQNTWIALNEVVGGIYSLQPFPTRWLFLLAIGTLYSPVAHRTITVHCPVCATSTRPLGFGASWPLEPLSCSCTGQSGATPDMSGVLWLLRDTVHHCSLCSRPLARSERCSAGSPDMSGAHWIVRWIIAERAQRIPESGWFICAWAWCTRQCPVLHLAAHSYVLLQIWLCPQLYFFLGLCWTLCTWDEWYLVSPRGLCWSSTTKIDFRKWLGAFLFQYESIDKLGAE